MKEPSKIKANQVIEYCKLFEIYLDHPQQIGIRRKTHTKIGVRFFSNFIIFLLRILSYDEQMKTTKPISKHHLAYQNIIKANQPGNWITIF